MSKPVNILGIETSCDETAAAIVTDGFTIRSSVVASRMNASFVPKFMGIRGLSTIPANLCVMIVVDADLTATSTFTSALSDNDTIRIRVSAPGAAIIV